MQGTHARHTYMGSFGSRASAACSCFRCCVCTACHPCTQGAFGSVITVMSADSRQLDLVWCSGLQAFCFRGEANRRACTCWMATSLHSLSGACSYSTDHVFFRRERKRERERERNKIICSKFHVVSCNGADVLRVILCVPQHQENQ